MQAHEPGPTSPFTDPPPNRARPALGMEVAARKVRLLLRATVLHDFVHDWPNTLKVLCAWASPNLAASPTLHDARSIDANWTKAPTMVP
jgi:hypothetical protein